MLLLVVASLVFTARILPGLQANNTIGTFLIDDDPGLGFYNETSDMFGGDYVLYVTVDAESGTIFSVPDLERIDRLSMAISRIEGVQKVLSLTTTDAVVQQEDAIFVGPLIAEMPSTDQEAARLEGKVISSSLLGHLVSADRSSSVLTVHLDPRMQQDPTHQNRAVRAIRQCLEAEQSRPGQILLTGSAVVAEALERYSNRDQRVFSSLMILLVAVSGLLVLRRFSAMLLPIVVVAVTVAWTMSLFVLAGHQTNCVTSIIPPILILVGVAGSIHFLFYYQAALARELSRREAVLETLHAITVPCFFTSLTTAVGFGSLMVSHVMPIRVFGTFAGLGMLLSFAAIICLVPTTLSLGGSRKGHAPSISASRPLKPFGPLTWIDNLVKGRPWTVLTVSGILTLLAASGLFRIRVETNVLKYFHEDTPVVRDALKIEEVYGGSSPLDVVIDTGRPDGALEPDVLKAVAALQDRYERIPYVTRGLSLADLVRELHKAVDDDPGGARIPDSKSAVSQLLLTLTTPEVLEPMVDPDNRMLRISTRFMGSTLGVSRARALMEEIRNASKGLFPSDIEVRLTGYLVLYLNMVRTLVRSQVHSFGIVLFVLTVLMICQFRSIRLGLVGMIPNIAPIAVVLGLMGWLDVPLDGFTVMIASIAIGIGVDDTIHFLHRLRSELARGLDLSSSISATIQGVGRPVLFTSVVLALGFWVFCFSDFTGTSNFGLLTGVTVIVALLADLLTLPAMLRLFHVI